MPKNNNWSWDDETRAALYALSLGPSIADKMRNSYLAATGNAWNIGRQSKWGGGWYGSTNPALAGRDVSGLTGRPIYSSMEEQLADKLIPFVNTTPPVTSPSTSITTPPVTTPPPGITTTPGNVATAAANLANASKPTVPQFIQPYQKPSGVGAYGESDIF